MSAALLVRILLWLWLAGAVAAGHWLVLQHLPAVTVPLLGPLLAAAVLAVCLRLATLREWLHRLDLRLLVLVHSLRLAGFYLLLLHERGELPRAFALPAGIGEIAIGVMAIPVALAPLADEARLRAIRIWNVAGLADICVLLFAALRLNLESPLHLHTLTRLPLSLIPTLFVPLILVLHVVILQRTARPASGAD